MRLSKRALAAGIEAIAALSAVVAVIYLVVACQSLPGFMGPVAGDNHPRTRLGLVFLIVAALLAAGGLIVARMPRRRR